MGFVGWNVLMVRELAWIRAGRMDTPRPGAAVGAGGGAAAWRYTGACPVNLDIPARPPAKGLSTVTVGRYASQLPGRSKSSGPAAAGGIHYPPEAWFR